MSTMFRRVIRRGCVAAVAATLVAGGMDAAGAVAAGSVTRYVAPKGTDTGDCSIKTSPCATIGYAVGQAAAGDTVSIAAGTYAENVTVTKSLTLLGAASSGANDTKITGAASPDPGNPTQPSLSVEGSSTSIGTPIVTVAIKDLDVSDNGNAAGIGVDSADATISGSVVSDNAMQGIETYYEGSGYEAPFVTVSKSTISDNGGPGIDVAGGTTTLTNSVASDNSVFGVLVEGGTAAVTQSTVDGNSAGGLAVDGGHTTALITHSTVSNNVPFAGPSGGGPTYGSGVVVFPNSSATVDTSTIYGNAYQGVLAAGGAVTVENSTVSGTQLPSTTGSNGFPGGALVTAPAPPGFTSSAQVAHRRLVSSPTDRAAAFVPDVPAATSSASGTISIVGSIDAANDFQLPDCAGKPSSYHDGGYNLTDDGTCAFPAKTSMRTTNAKLAFLANNGGPTETVLPADASPAVDAIPLGSGHCDTQTTDQRGVSRPQGPKCDIGAVELAQKPITIGPKTLPHGRVAARYTAQLTATGGLVAPYTFALAAGSGPLPAGLALSKAGRISGTPTTKGSSSITVVVDGRATKTYRLVIDKKA